jgi:hypothetical protein
VAHGAKTSEELLQDLRLHMVPKGKGHFPVLPELPQQTSRLFLWLSSASRPSPTRDRRCCDLVRRRPGARSFMVNPGGALRLK